MNNVVVLAMPGVLPKDFPPHERHVLYRLRARMKYISVNKHPEDEDRLNELLRKARCWPRTAQNDPLHFSAQELASELSQVTGYRVILGFNQYDTPTLEEALVQAFAREAEKIVLINPLAANGVSLAKSESFISNQRIQNRCLEIQVDFSYSFSADKMVELLEEQLGKNQ